MFSKDDDVLSYLRSTFDRHPLPVLAPVLVLLAYIASSLIVLFTTKKRRVINTRTDEPVPCVGIPKHLPWLFADFRCAFKFFYRAREWIEGGYYKYTKQGKPFIVKTWSGDVVMLNKTMLEEMKNVSDEEINTGFDRILMTRYTMTSDVTDNPYHHMIIQKDLTAQLKNLNVQLHREVLAASDEILSTCGKPAGEGWSKIVLFPVLMKILARSANLAFVGAPLCRNQEYLDAMIGGAALIPVMAIPINFAPTWMHWLLGPLLTLPIRRHFRTAYRLLRPEILKRLSDIKSGTPESEQPNDLLQWVIRNSFKYGPREANPESIAMRVFATNFASVHTTALSTTHMLYDLAVELANTPEGKKSTVDLLREEAAAAKKSAASEYDNNHNGNVKSESPESIALRHELQQLPKLDAFFKESLRLDMSGAIIAVRRVISPQGWTSKEGYFFPCGTTVAYPALYDTLDNDTYENAERHDIYRYDLEIKDAYRKEDTANGNGKDGKQKKGDGYYGNITNKFLAFGYGKHACPGRFFAGTEVRMFVANFLEKWDVKPLGKRPKDIWVGNYRAPDTFGEIEIRRRV